MAHVSFLYSLVCISLPETKMQHKDYENHPALCKHQSYCFVTLGQTVISPQLTYVSYLSSSTLVVVLGLYWRVQIVSDIITEPETNDLSYDNNELKSLKVHGDSRGLILALHIFIFFIYYVLQALNRYLIAEFYVKVWLVQLLLYVIFSALCIWYFSGCFHFYYWRWLSQYFR